LESEEAQIETIKMKMRHCSNSIASPNPGAGGLFSRIQRGTPDARKQLAGGRKRSTRTASFKSGASRALSDTDRHAKTGSPTGADRKKNDAESFCPLFFCLSQHRFPSCWPGSSRQIETATTEHSA